MRKCLSLILVLTLLFSLTTCSKEEAKSEGGTVVQTNETVPPESTTIPCPEQVVISNGNVTFGQIYDKYYVVDSQIQSTVDLKYNYQPRDVNIAIEEWSSSDETVVKVNDHGVLTPVGYGDCVITLHVSDGLTNGSSTSITAIVEDGIVEFSECDLPDYSKILEYAKTNVDEDISYEKDDNWNDIDDSYYCYVNGCWFSCIKCESKFYEPLDIEAYIMDVRIKKSRFYMGRTDDLLMIVYSEGVMIFTDNYTFRLIDDNFESMGAIMKDLGFPDPSEYFDIVALQ